MKISFSILVIVFGIISNTAFAQIYPNGMISYWKLDGNVGVTASDTVGTNDGSIHGAAWTTGLVNNALRFDGIDDYVIVPYSESLNSPYVTLEAWVYLNSDISGHGHIIQKPFSPNGDIPPFTQYSLFFHYNSTHPAFDLIINGSYRKVDANMEISVNAWHHIVGTYDGSYMRIYVDGDLKNSLPVSGNISSYSTGITIGRHYHIPSWVMDAIIDEVALYNRALTPEEILWHYQNGLNGHGYEEVKEVVIDIKPGSTTNSINLDSAGVIPVAILSSESFDATSVNPETIALAGAKVKMVGKGNKYLSHEEDVNEDGLTDIICQVYTEQFMIEVGESIAVLEATTYDGIAIRGEDIVTIVP